MTISTRLWPMRFAKIQRGRLRTKTPRDWSLSDVIRFREIAVVARCRTAEAKAEWRYRFWGWPEPTGGQKKSSGPLHV
jgi:hypothetical protein